MQLLHHLYIHKSRKTDPYKIFNYFFESWHTQDQYKRHQCCKSSCRGNVWNLLYKCKKYSQLTHHFDEYKLQIHMTTNDNSDNVCIYNYTNTIAYETFVNKTATRTNDHVFLSHFYFSLSHSQVLPMWADTCPNCYFIIMAILTVVKNLLEMLSHYYKIMAHDLECIFHLSVYCMCVCVIITRLFAT